MNALAATALDPVNTIAAQTAGASVHPATVKFATLINVLTVSIGAPAALVSLSGLQERLMTGGSQQQIADALIRSMLGIPVRQINNQPAGALTETEGDPEQLGIAAATLASESPDSPEIAADIAIEPPQSGRVASTGPRPKGINSTPSSKRPGKDASAEALSGTSILPPSTGLVTLMNTAPPAPAFTPAATAIQNDSRSTARSTVTPNETRGEAPQSAPAPIEELAFSVRLTAADIGPEIDVMVPTTSAPQPALLSREGAQGTLVPPLVPQEEAIAAVPDLPETIVAPPLRKPAEFSASAPRTASPDTKTRNANGDRQETAAPLARVAAVGAVSDAGDFSRAFASAVPTADFEKVETRESNTHAPFNSVAEAFRTSEPMVEPTSVPAAYVQGITLRVAPPEAPAVDLHVTERGGEIHVAVRTSDTTLQMSLRQDLGTLTNSLERAGYRAETYIPRETSTQAVSPPQGTTSNDRQQQGSSGRGSGGNPSNAQQQRQQQPSDQRRKHWLQELENLK